ncbi:unnamed protein product [Orchesella dallaii]|uniref:Uncharacterized protein n=1 Tax=Orchesella dallaii TaxID=48710 RepID=A0ABP1Q938_9HEXA
MMLEPSSTTDNKLMYLSLDKLVPTFNEPKHVSFRNRLHLYGYVHRQQIFCSNDIMKTNSKSSRLRELDDNIDVPRQRQRKPIFESGDELLYRIPETDVETSKESDEIMETSAYYKEPIESIISRDDETMPYSSVSYKFRKQRCSEISENEALISVMSVHQAHQVVYEYEDDDDVEDEQKRRQRIIQIICLGAIGLGIVTVSSIYVAFYLNQISHH